MPKAEKRIRFHFLKKGFYLPNRTFLKQFIVSLVKQHGLAVEHINYIFCSDKYLLQINRQYLNHDTYTDIITFQLSPVSAPIVADVYISIDRVKENARHFEASIFDELHRVIFHGALHLCGHKDKTSAQKKKMREMEDLYLLDYVSREKRTKKV